MRNYRGLTKEGKMVYGWYGEDKNGRAWIYHLAYSTDTTSYMTFSDVIKETVGQSTGLKDKNGVEIYDGDKFYLPGKEYRVEWNGITPGWTLHPTKDNDAQLLNINYVRDAVIIGNIHTEE